MPTVLHTFTGGITDGSVPGALLLAPNGTLYGSTNRGGGGCSAPGCGTIFKLSPPLQGQTQWTETILYEFSDRDGSVPLGGLVSSQGYLFGVTLFGGANGTGTVFRLVDTSDQASPVITQNPTNQGAPAATRACGRRTARKDLHNEL
jgi:uncharacterized repeat protein (TIGR03803 family)